ncbi:uncharacterized protein TNCV_882001 [Trichonephila clavipes]|nr:uncharacterized protein TNCV_882001 [Trichonephila clavipes]
MSVHHDHSQTANRAKFMLVPTSTPPAIMPANCRARLQWCSARLGWNRADWGHIVSSNESRFQLCLDDHRRRV